MKRAVILILVIASGVAFFAFADLESISSAVFSMPGETFLLLIALLAGAEVVAGLRWAFFLRASGLKIRIIDGLTSFVAAQAATAVPGGSLLSARLAEEHGHVRMHQAAASLVGQQIADLGALALVAATAILITSQQPMQLLVPFAAVTVAIAGVAVFRSRRLAQWVSNVAGRWRLTRRYISMEAGFLHHCAALMRPRTLAIGVAFSLVTTTFSAFILLLIINTLTRRGVTGSEAFYVHSLSVVARMAVPIPGGIGVSDVSLTGMLNFVGIGLARATFVALAYRSTGLLFRTAFGILVLIVRYPHVLVGTIRLPSAAPARAHRWTARAARLRAQPQPVPVVSAEPLLVEHDTQEIASATLPGRPDV